MKIDSVNFNLKTIFALTLGLACSITFPSVASAELTEVLLQSKKVPSQEFSLGSSLGSLLKFGFNEDDQKYLQANARTLLQADLTRDFTSRAGRRGLSHLLRNNETLREIAEGRVALNFNPFEMFRGISKSSDSALFEKPQYRAVVLESESPQQQGKKIAAASSEADGFEFLDKEKVAADLFHRRETRRTIVEEFLRQDELAEAQNNEPLLNTSDISGELTDNLNRVQKTLGLARSPFSLMEMKVYRKNGDAAQGLGMRLRESNDLMFVGLPFGKDMKKGLSYGLRVPYKSHAAEWLVDSEQSAGQIFKTGLFQVGESYLKAAYFVEEKRYLLETKFVF